MKGAVMRSRGALAVVAIAVVVGAVALGWVVSQGRDDGDVDVALSAVAVCAQDVPNCDDAATTDDGAVVDSDLPRGPGVGGGDAPVSSALVVDGGIGISEAISYEGTQVVAVRGFFVSVRGQSRLCELLAESYPPQCAGVSVVITNPDALPGGDLRQEGDTRWSEGYVTVLGNIDGGELTIASNVSG